MARTDPPELGVSGNQFTVNGQPKFLLFVSYFDAIRREMSQTNTGVDADFAYIKSKNYDGVRIFPNWQQWPGTQASDGALFTTSGDLDTTRKQKFLDVLDKAGELGLLVDVSFTVGNYGGTVNSTFLNTIHKKQLEDITLELKDGYKHVFFDIQNEWEVNVPDFQAEVRALVAAVRAKDPNRLVTVSSGDRTQAGGWALDFGVDIAAYHDDRTSDWYQHDKLRDEIAAVRAAISAGLPAQNGRPAIAGRSMPIHLQEPYAIGSICPPRCDFDSDSAHANEAASAAKQYAAGWTFHTRSTFVLTSQRFIDILNNDSAQKATFDGLAAAVAQQSPDPTVPGKATITDVVRAGSQAVTVKFDPPASNGYSNISVYRIVANPGQITDVLAASACSPGTCSQITLTGLTNGTSYTLTLQALNGVGYGDVSAPSNAIIPATVPGAPTGVAAAAGNAQASVTFTAPSSNGGSPITEYIATSSPGGFNNTGSTTPIVVSGLTNGVSYTFTVKAKNAVGDSASSSASNAVTPTAPPFGQVDTPSQNAGGVQGAIAVTGWVLDDVETTTVKIYRNCLGGFDSANCQTVLGQSLVYIGDASFVPNARPDVEAAFPTYPFKNRAGWGYMMLTLMLPHVTNSQPYGGQGALTIYAIATDTTGNKKILGRTTSDSTPTSMTMTNDSIAKPVGTLDTPGQGQTISGTFNNFGWVLTPDSNTTGGEGGDILMPTDGSTITVYIDGIPKATVAYNQCRGNVGNPVPGGVFCNDDVANIFGNTTPQPVLTTRTSNPTKWRNLDAGRGAIGAYTFDTTLLANGLHSIAWGVADSQGRTEGIGSRNFTVSNGGGQFQSRGTQEQALGEKSTLDGKTQVTAGVSGRTGLSLGTRWTKMHTNREGTYNVRLPESGRLELWLGPVEAGYLVANDTLRPLPVGSTLLDSGFVWMPPPGYVGPYSLAFVRGGERIDVTVTVVEKPRALETKAQQVRMQLDAAVLGASGVGASLAERTVRLDGWAFDPQASIGSGIGAVHLWAVPLEQQGSRGGAGTSRGGNTPFFLGSATLDQARPDVKRSQDGAPGDAGFSLTASLPPGRFVVTASVWNERTERWEDTRSVQVVVR